MKYRNFDWLLCFLYPDKVLLWRYCQCWSSKLADSRQKKTVVSDPLILILWRIWSLAVFHSIPSYVFHSRGLFGYFFPYTSHVLFTDLRHSRLNDVRKETFNSKRSALPFCMWWTCCNVTAWSFDNLWDICYSIVYNGDHSMMCIVIEYCHKFCQLYLSHIFSWLSYGIVLNLYVLSSPRGCSYACTLTHAGFKER